MNKRIISGFVMAAAMSLIAGGSLAADGKQYPGATCRQTSGGSLAFFGGTILNASSTSELNVMCPFVLDVGAGVTNGFVKFHDRNAAVGNSCTFFAEFPNNDGTGTIQQDFETASTTALDSSVNPFTRNIGNLFAGEYYYATCSIARSSAGNFSHISTININET